MVTAGATPLIVAVEALRDQLAGARLELDLAGVEEARSARAELIGQIDDYLLPRLRRLDAPLLAVVGGSTGAGKSTLVNSLVGAEVSPAGVLRPTTRAAVLVCNPSDERSWMEPRVLPGLPRATGRPTADPGTLGVVAHPGMAAGIALLDAPDIDSVVESNVEIATQLLAAADLWLFVTTAGRYADAVPWDFLRSAAARSTALALVLNRVPPEALAEVPAHLAELLEREGLGRAPVFTVPESGLEDGLLPRAASRSLREWLDGLAADSGERAIVIRATLEGALESLDDRVALVATHVDAQAASSRALQDLAVAAYAGAREEVADALSGGSLLRGEVLARWHEVVGTGDLMRGLESRIGMLRDRLRRALMGEAAPEEEVRATLAGSLETVVVAASERAAERAAAAWREAPGGRSVLSETPWAGRASEGGERRVADEVRAWQGRVLELVRSEGAGKRTLGRAVSLGVNAVGAALMVSVFAHTGGLTGAEIAVAGGTVTVSQKLLEAIFGDQAVRELTKRARTDLMARVDGLLDTELERYLELARAAAPTEDGGARLRAAAGAVRRDRP